MKKILVLYHSGVGNTKIVAKKIKSKLLQSCLVDIHSVEKIPTTIELSDYDGLVIGFPVIHTAPSKRIMEFINTVKPLPKPMPTYLFDTCGLYSANTLRIFAKRCISHNIIPVLCGDYCGCPATDGVLLAPYVKRFFQFSPNLDEHLTRDVQIFMKNLNTKTPKAQVPRFKWYSILNYPNKVIGQHVTFKIYLHKQKCVRCGKCIRHCPSGAISKDEQNFPGINMKACEKCYRCIHHCPVLALSLNKKQSPKKVLIRKNGVTEI